MAAARAVLKDWNEGKIPYFTAPPADTGEHKKADAVIVTEFAADFDAMDAAVLASIKDEDSKDEMDFVQLSAQPVERQEWKGFDEDDDDDDEDMDDESESEGEGKPSLAKRRQQLAKAEDYSFDDM